MASVILDFYDEDAPSTLLGSLEDDDLESLEHRAALFDLGALVFKVPKATADANPTLLRKTNLVRVRYPTPMGSTRVWAGILKDYKSVIISHAEEHGEYIEWTAPGILYMLSYGALTTASTVSDQPARGSYDDVPARDWIWTDEPYGAIITRVIEEGRHAPFPDPAATDSPFEDIDIDFDRVNDSNGNPWANIAEEFRVPIGSNMLEVISRLATAGDVFLVMDPDLTLHAYQQYTDFATDRTGSFGAGNVRWEKGVNILTELSRSSTALQLTHLLQRDSDGNTSTEVAAGYTSGKEHWGWAEAESTNDDATLNKIAQRTIDASGADAEQIAFEVVPGDDDAAGEYFPFLHYDPGDLVTVHTGTTDYDLEEASMRLVAFRITLDEASKSTTAEQAYRSLHVVPELQYRPLHTYSAIRDQLGEGGGPGCTCLRLCQPGIPGDPGTANSVVIERTWDYEEGTNLSTDGDHGWLNYRAATESNCPAIPGAHGHASGTSGANTFSGRLPCVEDGLVTMTGSIARNWFTDNFTSGKYYWIRFFAASSGGSVIASQTWHPGSFSRNVAADYSFEAITPTGANYFEVGGVIDNTSHDNVHITSYDTDGTPPTPGTPGDLPLDTVEQGLEQTGTGSAAAHCDHQHAHGLLSPDGTDYHSLSHLSDYVVETSGAPTVDDDTTLGYVVGSHWIDTDDGTVYILTDATDGAAVWEQLSGAGVTDHGALTGLGDDDHTQYVLRSLLTTRGDLPYRGASDWARRAIGTDGYSLKSDGTDPVWEAEYETLNLVMEGAGSVVTTGIKADLVVDFAAYIESATLLADQSGSIVVDIWKDTYGNYPPVVGDSITASAKPTLSSATKSQDATLTGWTRTIAAGDTLRFNVDSVSTITRVTLALKLRRT